MDMKKRQAGGQQKVHAWSRQQRAGIQYVKCPQLSTQWGQVVKIGPSQQLLNDSFTTIGPALPQKLFGPSIIGNGQEYLILLGGSSGDDYKTLYNREDYKKSIYKLECSSGSCTPWAKMNQELKIGRIFFVAIPFTGQ